MVFPSPCFVPIKLNYRKSSSESSIGFSASTKVFFLNFTVKVKSTTVQGSRNHPRENVKANIVIGNIPVANGVVHLIDKPLIIVASPLWDYLQEEVRDCISKRKLQVSYKVFLEGEERSIEQIRQLCANFWRWPQRSDWKGGEWYGFRPQ